jgi:diguanylate cyclase (GGDEF)-like protein
MGAVSVVLCVVVGFVVHRKTRKKYDVVNFTEVNTMLSEILEANFRNNSLSSAAQSILIVLKRFYNIDYVTIFLHHDSKDVLEVIASNVDNRYLKTLEGFANESYRSIGQVVAKVLTSDDGPVGYESSADRGISFCTFTPLAYEGKLIGAIMLENSHANAVVRSDLYAKVFTNTALVLQSVLHTENLIKMTSTDQLTGVYNRRFIDMTLGEQLSIHRNLGLSFSVALFDIDHFKKFNDTYGHAFGDLVLKEVAKFMNNKLGGNAWIARYGGEEFVLFFGRSVQSEVLDVVESLREGLSKLQLTDGETTTSVTASFGVATFPQVDSSVNDIIGKADTALYQSKRAGRNTVTVFK